MEKINGFRLGIYVFKDAEIVDFAAPYGVFSVARRFDASFGAFFVSDANKLVQTQAGFTVLPNYSFSDEPAVNAFLIPGGYGTRQEIFNGRLHEYIKSLPKDTLFTSVCTGSWVYAQMGLLDGITEWRYACKAGITGYRYGEIKDIAWYCENSEGRIHEAGKKEPNKWGLYDMLGNAWEWCWDLYDEKTYGPYRVFHGGSWAESARGCGASCRRRGHPSFCIDDLGLRLSKSI